MKNDLIHVQAALDPEIYAQLRMVAGFEKESIRSFLALIIQEKLKNPRYARLISSSRAIVSNDGNGGRRAK